MHSGSPQPEQYGAAGFPAGPPSTGTHSRHLKRHRNRVMGQREHTHTLGRRAATPPTTRSATDLPPFKRVVQICAQQSIMLGDHGGAELVEEWGFGRRISQWKKYVPTSAPGLAGSNLIPHKQKCRHRSGAHHAQTFSQASPGTWHGELLRVFVRRRSPCQVHRGRCSLRACGQKAGQGLGARPGHALLAGERNARRGTQLIALGHQT